MNTALQWITYILDCVSRLFSTTLLKVGVQLYSGDLLIFFQYLNLPRITISIITTTNNNTPTSCSRNSEACPGLLNQWPDCRHVSESTVLSSDLRYVIWWCLCSHALVLTSDSIANLSIDSIIFGFTVWTRQRFDGPLVLTSVSIAT